MLKKFLLITTLSLVGCGGDDGAPRETTHVVTGKVTLYGTPLAGAVIGFSPLDGQRSAVGISDAEGNYTLRTYEPGDGAVAGKFKIVVTKAEVQADSGGETEGADHEAVAMAASEHNADSGTSQRSMVPPQYTNKQDTPFVFEVTAAGPNEYDLVLE